MERGQRSHRHAWRVAHVEALRLARALTAGAVVFRHYAGRLRYHPQTGIEGSVGDDLLAALAAIREQLAAIGGLAARWDEEITWLRTMNSAMPLDDIQRGHAAAREAATLLRATLEVFDHAVLHPETARLDAPYGAGAPQRPHPGAQCTWVAERAEGLARELSTVTLRKENVLLNAARR